MPQKDPLDPKEQTYYQPGSLKGVKDLSDVPSQPTALGPNPNAIQKGVVESESANRGKAALFRGNIMDSGCLDLIVKMAMTGYDYSYLEVPVGGGRVEVQLVRGEQLDETTKAKYLQLLLNKTVGTAATQKESVQEPENVKWLEVIQKEKDKMEIDVDVGDDHDDEGTES